MAAAQAQSQPDQGALAGLNDAQRAAAASDAAVLQILAPPGSGKTKTLTARVGHLIASCGLQPRNIIVCTFTVKAAREVKERIAAFLGAEVAAKLFLGTFHSIAHRLLLFHGAKIGLDKGFQIADSSDSLSIIKRLIVQRKLTIEAQTARSRISSLKSRGISAETFRADMKVEEQQEIATVYQEYEDYLFFNRLLDYDDLLLRCVELLRLFPTCVARIEAVLIDEFQDTNNVQYELMSLFAQHKKHITTVGDPDQSIFGWRNAELKNLYKMQKDYADTHVVHLEQNYRSSGAILCCAQEMIEQDLARPQKKLMPTLSVGLRPVLRRLETPAKEAKWIASEIKRTQELCGGLLQLDDYAILIRSAYLSRHLESALSKARIPYRMVGGLKFFERLEVKIVLNYLRVVSHPFNNEALIAVINVPPRKLGDVSVELLVNEATSRKTPLWPVLLGFDKLKSQAAQGLYDFTRLIRGAQKLLKQETMTLPGLVSHIIQATGLEEYLRKAKAGEFDARWGNVQELVAQAGDYAFDAGPDMDDDDSDEDDDSDDSDEEDPAPGSDGPPTLEQVLAQYLANIALSSEDHKALKDAQQPSPQVTISTIHASKGLEWPAVFVPGAYNGSIPHSRAEDTDEERRLLYVALTRAQGLLYVTQPLRDAKGEDAAPSQFLAGAAMRQFFDKRGCDYCVGAVTELAAVLRRPAVEVGVLTKALAACRRPTDGEGDAKRNDYPDRNGYDEYDEVEYKSCGEYSGRAAPAAALRHDAKRRKLGLGAAGAGGHPGFQRAGMPHNLAAMTTMAQPSAYSINNTTLPAAGRSSFVSAAAVMATAEAAKSKSSKDKATKGGLTKTKTGWLRDEAAAAAQTRTAPERGGLAAWLVTGSAQASGPRPATAYAVEVERDKSGVLREVINLDAPREGPRGKSQQPEPGAGSTGSAGNINADAQVSRPAAILHTTTTAQLGKSSTSTTRTLGARRRPGDEWQAQRRMR